MKYFFLALISAVFTITVSGCASYNASYSPAGSHEPLTGSQISKLNGIMFAYLDISAAKFSIIPPRTKHAAVGNFYRPHVSVKIMAGARARIQKAGIKPGYNGKPSAGGYDKNTGKDIQPYAISVFNGKLFLKIYSKQTVAINKNFSIAGVLVDLKNIRYDKGYEVVSMSLENKGQTKTIMENFKYSNAGNSFELRKFEIIQNLTVANKYKRGVTLWVSF